MEDKAKKITKNREKKQTIVAELSNKVKAAKAIVFTNYQGLTHKQLEGLKKALKKVDAEMVVAKNTLLRIALDIGNLKLDIGNSLEGQTATLFAYSDVIAPLKELAKTIKALNLPVVKFGILDGQSVTDAQILKLATLPPRQVLLAQVARGLKSPLFGLHRALNWNLQRLVLTLNAIQKTNTRR